MSAHRQHFLIAAYPVQSHINPALHLAHRLASAGALVTFSTSTSAHNRILLSSATSRGDLTFLPYPDAYATRPFRTPDSASPQSKPDHSDFTAAILGVAPRVTCVIHTLLLTWAADAARDIGIPWYQYWIQPATALAAYYHFFHGHEPLISAHSKDPHFPLKLPNLPPMQIRDLPSFLTTPASDGGPYSMMLPLFRKCFADIDSARPKILVNTCEDLEPEALASVQGQLDIIPIGPVPPVTPLKLDLFDSDEASYMGWLDGRADKSVVYVSFGSISVLTKGQVGAIGKGLRGSGRPYLWVVRKDSRQEGGDLEEGGDEGMIVEWCSQARVLGHRAVGCFVTHCGWNSTVESLVSGVPTVGVPQWVEQGTNAMLMERAWGTGVRAEVREDGVVEGEELRRCLDLVMGDGERGREIRRNAGLWKEKANRAVEEGGSSDRNLRTFVDEITDV